MRIRKSTPQDLDRIMELYALARKFMAEHGNPNQWGPTNWPPERLIRNDIRDGNSYVCVNDSGKVIGTFFFVHGPDVEPTYRRITDGAWRDDSPYGVIHRIAADGSEKGIGRFCINWAFEQCGHLQIDTHGDNIEEKDRRLVYLRQHDVSRIDEYNEAHPEAPLKRIILFVDELGECLDKSGMTKEQKETVDLITQGLNTLCRLGRAVGISCILSTQRGSADLISGQIRNNALKIVGQCDENLSLLTIGTADAATELSHPGQFMDENKNVFQGFYADYTALLKKQESGARMTP